MAKVKTRTWPIEKFSAAVEARCKRDGIKVSKAKIQEAYDNLMTVASTVASFAPKAEPKASRSSPKKAGSRKAAAAPPA